MRNKMKRLIALSGAVLVLVLCFPVTAFALDPITDAAIINAWAQAVAAYGAANGVQMNFDISNTDQIGEGVHDLWSDYESEMAAQDPLPFTTAATLFWQTGFTKIGNSLGIDISAELAGALDSFWNWLLTGPAEIVKVDNQYVWPTDASGNPVVIPIHQFVVLLPVLSNPAANETTFSSGFFYFDTENSSVRSSYSASSNGSCFLFYATADAKFYFVSDVQNTAGYSVVRYIYPQRTQYSLSNWDTRNLDSVSGLYYRGISHSAGDMYSYYYCPVFADFRSGMTYASGIVSDGSAGNVSIEPTGPVTIPDNEDVNYQPLPVGIGIDIPWDASKYGDGTGTLTDAQKGEMVGDIDQQIEETGSVVLDEDAADDPTDDPSQEVIGGPNDYVVPGLEDVFPFCIPFDIYHFLAALAAEPVAPHFTAQLAFPAAVGGTQTIDLDFNTPTFNQIAQILRTLELLAFIVGLALLTRSMFIRG